MFLLLKLEGLATIVIEYCLNLSKVACNVAAFDLCNIVCLTMKMITVVCNDNDRDVLVTLYVLFQR